MKVIANNLSVGTYIKLNNEFCKIIEKTNTKPGKGHAYVQLILKNIKGVKINHKFCSSDYVETVFIEKKIFIFSYEEKNIIFLIEEKNLENTIEITKDNTSKTIFEYLKTFGMNNNIIIEFANDEIINISFEENNVKTIVSYADPYIKGQTASATNKKAKIENDKFEINVPVHIKKDDEILVNIENEEINFVKKNS